MFNNLKQSLKCFSAAFVEEFGPEKYSEDNIGNLESYNAVNGGGLLSSIKTEVNVGEMKYIIEGALNGVQLGSEVVLRHWPVTHQAGPKYLIIDGNRFRIAS